MTSMHVLALLYGVVDKLRSMLCLVSMYKHWCSTNVFCITGAHTNTIEGAWKHATYFCRPKKLKTICDLHTLSYVHMWRQLRGRDWPGGFFVRLLNDIKNLRIVWIKLIISALSMNFNFFSHLSNVTHFYCILSSNYICFVPVMTSNYLFLYIFFKVA